MRAAWFVVSLAVAAATFAPAEIQPAEGSMLNRTHVLFTWDVVPGAVSYDLQVVVDDGSPDPFAGPVVASVSSALPESVVTSGLVFGEDYAWRVRGVTGGGPLAWESTNRMSTLPLPGYAPVLNTSYDPNALGALEGGVTILPLRGGTVPGGFIVAVDRDGNIVWFIEPGSRVSDPRLLPSGNVLYMSDFRGFEADIAGNVVWSTPDDPNMLVHHEVFPMPGGNRMMLLYTYHDVERYPPGDVNRSGRVDLEDLGLLLADFGCATWPCVGDADLDIDVDLDDLTQVLINFGVDGVELQKWRGDRVLELDPNNNIVWEFVLADHLAETDFDYDHMAVERIAGGPADNSYDWTHCNSVTYNPADNSVYISVRSLSQVWRVDYATGEIVYQMGFQMPSGTAAFGDGFFSFQHAPELQPNGNILLFDNGNRRDRIVHPNNSTDTISRAIEISLTGNPPTSASIVWEWVSPFYSFALGDADRLPNGNTLVVNGTNATISEVDASGDLVWQLTGPAGIGIYRAQRVPTLYPGHP